VNSRYLISSPALNKESYFNTDKVRSAFVPVDGEITILNDTPDQTIDYVFSSTDSLYSLPVNPYFYFILSINQIMSETNINLPASHLYRIHTSFYKRVIYGNVLIFGSKNPSDIYSKDLYHSIPYEVMEQLFLYNKSQIKK
jgi:hypothetical protein